MPDKILTCSDCGQQFTFTEEDQEFYATRGFSEPKRCRSCRAARRNEREGTTGGAGGVGAGAGMDRPPRQDRELFDAVCASCGQPTKVPFQPRGDRPVYCRDCFERMGGGNRGGGAGNRAPGGYGGTRTGGGGRY